MLFVDDIGLVDENEGRVNRKLELWSVLESKDFRLCRSKMEYIECGFCKIRNRDQGEVKIKDHDVSKSNHFQYLDFDYS